MTTFILVHGGNVSSETWNNLVGHDDYPSNQQLGGCVWDKVADGLKKAGHSVYAPMLLDEYQYDLSAHVAQIVECIQQHQLHDVHLVGHSYGGMVITGVATTRAKYIEQLTYVDAALPMPGQSLFDLLNLAGIKPNTVITGKPKAYIEPLNFDMASIDNMLKRYIFCKQSQFQLVTEVAKKAMAAYRGQWQCYDLNTSHLPQATAPKALTDILLGSGIQAYE